MNEFEKKVLNYLNIDETQYEILTKKVSYDDLEDPYDFLNMKKAVDRIQTAIKNKEKIMIYGDYDCDGISATSILVKMFLSFGIKVGYYIPSRYIDGYGINLNRAEQIKEKNYSLVITVDNGVAAKEAIDYLTDHNIDVILTDHHAITRDLPNCYCVLHPDLKNKMDVVKECGAYVAFMLSWAVLGRIDDYLLSLACIATISDMMPLKSHNRTIVRLGLDIINKNKNYPLWKLCNANDVFDEETLGFTICPKINAFGRIKEDMSVNDIVRFLITDDEYIKNRIANEIELINNQRKTILADSINKINFEQYQNDKVVIARFDDISEGVIGLIAARMLNTLNKPVIVFTKVKNGSILKGSARSIEGFNLEDAFNELSNYLVVYGGHALAGGLSIEEKNFETFKMAVEHYALDKKLCPEEDKYLECRYTDFTYDNYLFVNSLKPFGIDFECPKFSINLNCDHIYTIGNNGTHIKGKINEYCSFIGFNMAEDIKNKQSVIAIGSLSYDTFKKGKNISFKLDKVI